MADWSHIRDEIKERLRLSEIVGRKVLWDRRKSQPGRGEFWACCPFHNEKSPSFHVLDREGYYKCFGCGAGGDAVEFVIQTENMSYREAMEMLAEEAGIELPKFSREAEEQAQARASLHEVLEKAAVYFEESLRLSIGEAARAYLKRRSLPAEIIKEFRLGYWPDGGQALIDHLKTQGVELEQMRSVGLLANREDGEARDHMRHRLIFPITDGRGRVVGFGGRALRDEQQPKYLNTGETELFHKGRTLYNFARARGRVASAALTSPLRGGRAAEGGSGGGFTPDNHPSADRSDATTPTRNAVRSDLPARGRLVVAEGYMDVIALHRAGFARAVAPLGTALTEEQLNLIWSVEDAPIICFDGDAAGLAAAGRALERALPLLKPGRTLQFAFLPPGQDPDDLLKASGPEAIAEVLASARGLAETYWDFTTNKSDLTTPDGRARAEAELYEGIRRISDPNVRRHYEAFLRGRIGAWFSQRRSQKSEIRNQKSDWRGPNKAFQPPVPRPTAELRARQGRGGKQAGDLTEDIFLLSLLTHPNIAHQMVEEVGAVQMSRAYAPLHGAILDGIARGAQNTDEIIQMLDEKGLAAAARRLISRQGLRCVPSAHPASPPEAVEAGLRELITTLAAKAEASEAKDQLKAALSDGLSDEAWAEVRRLHAAAQKPAGRS